MKRDRQTIVVLLLLANAGVLGLNILLYRLVPQYVELGQRIYQLIAVFERVIHPFLDAPL